MADQALVPKGLAYGERQNQVSGRQRAGLALDPPTSTTSAPPPAPAAAPSGAGGGSGAPGQPTTPEFDPLLETTPADFPGVSSPGGPGRPMQASMTAQEYAFDLASRSQNGLLRAVAARRANGS